MDKQKNKANCFYVQYKKGYYLILSLRTLNLNFKQGINSNLETNKN